MAEPASPSSYFRLLDLLVEQTKFGNIPWERGAAPDSFIFEGTGGMVALASRDGDGDYPIVLRILDKDGRAVESFVTFEQSSDPQEVFWDERVRTLWGLLNPKADPVASLISDLERLPPF